MKTENNTEHEFLLVAVIAFALYIIFILIRFWYWWTNVRGYKYYLLSNTFLTNNNGINDIHNYSIKIKAKSKDEALDIWNEVFRYQKYTEKGNVVCIEWDKMIYYENKSD